jgi:hypothetical protein
MGGLLVAIMVSVVAVASEDTGPYLQTISVNVKAAHTQGSGTVVNVPREEGAPLTFVLTAAHVIKPLREVRTVVDKDGKDKKVISYRDAQVVHERTNEEGTRVVGESRLDARVLNVDTVRDIALLHVRAVGQFKASAKFYQGGRVPAVGIPILHCGCPGGQDVSGTGAVTAGIISRIGVRIPDFGGSEHGVYDHVDCAALGGSSGGMIAMANDGRWVGMITLGLRSGDSFHWMVPIRSVRGWAKEINASWLLDPDATVDDKMVKEIPLENEAGSSGDSAEEEGAPKLLPDNDFVRMVD